MCTIHPGLGEELTFCVSDQAAEGFVNPDESALRAGNCPANGSVIEGVSEACFTFLQCNPNPFFCGNITDNDDHFIFALGDIARFNVRKYPA